MSANEKRRLNSEAVIQLKKEGCTCGYSTWRHKKYGDLGPRSSPIRCLQVLNERRELEDVLKKKEQQEKEDKIRQFVEESFRKMAEKK